MRVQIWHSPEMDEWRWSLTTRTYGKAGVYHQETGSRSDLREAMGDVANTIEYLMHTK